jgi:hypothetical protein
VQLGAFCVVLYVSAPQLVQTRLEEALPAVLTYWPELQSLHGVQLSALVVVL